MSNTSACWNFVADFGDIAVLGPATCATCLTLWLRGHRHEALVWALSFAGCVTATVLMKATIGFVDVDLAGYRLVLKSPPSGHTAVSVAFYGSLAAFLWAALPPAWGRAAAAAVLVTLTGLIGGATIILKWHTSFDVLAGLLVGVIFTVALARTANDRPGSRQDGLAISLAALITIAVFHGYRLDESAPAILGRLPGSLRWVFSFDAAVREPSARSFH